MHFTRGVTAGTVERIMINYTISNLQMKVDFSMEVEVLKILGSWSFSKIFSLRAK